MGRVGAAPAADRYGFVSYSWAPSSSRHEAGEMRGEMGTTRDEGWEGWDGCQLLLGRSGFLSLPGASLTAKQASRAAGVPMGCTMVGLVFLKVKPWLGLLAARMSASSVTPPPTTSPIACAARVGVDANGLDHIADGKTTACRCKGGKHGRGEILEGETKQKGRKRVAGSRSRISAVPLSREGRWRVTRLACSVFWDWPCRCRAVSVLLLSSPALSGSGSWNGGLTLCGNHQDSAFQTEKMGPAGPGLANAKETGSAQTFSLGSPC